MAETYFFDVPVYRLPEARYYDEMNAYIERNMYPGPPDQKLLFSDHLRDAYGGAWTFNEIVGWIRLHFLGTQIRGEYWGMKAKRVVRTRRKIFAYRSWKLAPEIDIPDEASNADIFSLIVEYLTDCSNELRGRYIHSELLMLLGPHIDWRTLLNRLS